MDSSPSTSEAKPSGLGPGSLRLALLCFFFSGATGLIYEVMWTRRLSLTFGHTVLAVSTVLTVFMAGLAAGSLSGGYWSDRQRRGGYFFLTAYGLLEAFIGIWALLSLVLLDGVEALYLSFARQGLTGFSLYLTCFVGAFVVLFPPTMAMGATLPVISRLLVQEKARLGDLLSKIYGVNTFGAFCGASAGGFFLLPLMGLKKAVYLGVALNLLIGVAAVLYARGKSTEGASAEGGEDGAGSDTAGNLVVPLTFGIAGVASMVYQIGWTRGLVLSIGSSTYAFSTILAAFLAGLGLGSFGYSRWMKGRSPALRNLATLQLVVAGFGIVVALCLGQLPRFVALMVAKLGANYIGLILGQFALSFVLLLGPTLAMGLMFPLATHLYSSDVTGLGRSLGQVYGANTLGCIIGSFLAGFLLIPALGAQTALKIAVVLNLLNALILLWPERASGSGALVLCAGLFLGLFLVPRWDRGLMSAGVGIHKQALDRIEEPTYYSDGISCTVTVGYNTMWHPYLKVNGKTDAAVDPVDMVTMYLVGYLPAVYHPNPESVAIVGFGAGFTVDAVTDVPEVKRVDCAEIEPAILEVGKYFSPFNGDALNDPRVHMVVTDGRTFVLGSPRKYDLIINQPSNPWIAGIGNLFTRDFYAGCKERLKPGGIMCQWFQLYSISTEDLQLVMRTFYSEFPHGAVFQNRGDVVFLGSESPLSYPEERIRASMEWDTEFPKRLVELGFARSDFLLGMYLAPREKMLEMVGTEGPVNLDDHPILEFSAPKSMFSEIRPVLDYLKPAVQLLPPGVEPDQEKALASVIGHALCRTPMPLEQAKQHIKDQEPPLYYYLLAVLAKQGGLENSEKDIISLLAKNQSSEARLLAGQYYFEKQEYEKALEAYRQVVEQPFPGSAYIGSLGAGDSARILKRYQEAVGYFSEAAQHTLSSEPLVKLAFCHRQLNQPQEALEALQQALERYPYDYRAHADLAQLYEEMGEAGKAREHIERARQLYPAL